MPKRVLRVYANPYTFIDQEGRPAGVYSHDPRYLPGQQHVGLQRLQTTTTEKRDPDKDPRPDVVDLVHHYDAEVQEVPDNPGEKHYRDGIREGSLIPADEATARAVGMKFEDPGAVLERARLRAIREWTDAHGEPPAFAADDDAHAHVPMGLRGRSTPNTDQGAWAKGMAAAAQPATETPVGTGDVHGSSFSGAGSPHLVDLLAPEGPARQAATDERLGQLLESPAPATHDDPAEAARDARDAGGEKDHS